MASDGSWTRTPLGTATEYVALGLAVLPECPPDCPTCEPRNKGKVPWEPSTGRHMSGWQQRGLPSDAELEAWGAADARRAAAGQAPANLGCRCGPGCLGDQGLIGADADGPRGLADLALHLALAPGVLEAAVSEYRQSGIFGPALGTAAYLTPSGGLRVLWRVPDGRALHTAGKDAGHDGLRLAWAGGQIVLPPSTRADGDYRWLPGHSPWQVGFNAPPTTVLAAMAGKGHRDLRPSVVLAPGRTAAYPAATGDSGPDRDGCLADSTWLPYDLDLLRDGAPRGQRSEAVRRLELQMLAAGWSTEQAVAALAGQPWVQAMRANITDWLSADVARAEAWRRAQMPQPIDAWGEAGPIHPDVVAWLQEHAARLDRQEDTEATACAGVSSDGDDAEERAAIQAEGCEVWPARSTDVGGADEAANLDPAVHGRSAPAWAYSRLRDGTRLRGFDLDRDRSVRAGLGQIHDFIGGLPHPTRSQKRLLTHVERLQGAFDRCRQDAWAHRHDLREPVRRAGAGGAWVWSDMPCDGRGHEDCAPYHALRELREQWGPALAEVYGAGPVAALAFSAPGWGLEATREAGTALLHCAKVQHALGLCAGFLAFEPGAAPGYALHLLVPRHRADELRALLLHEWRRRVPCGWVRTLDDLPAQSTALEAMVELRVRSEQAILLALGSGEVEQDQAINLYAAETGVFSGTNLGGQRQRLVVAPGMRTLAQDLAAGRQPLAQAVGDDSGGASTPGGPVPQGTAGAAPAIRGMGSSGADPFPLSQGAVPCIASGAGPAGVSPGDGGAPPVPALDDDSGWVPCPWDPTLEMRRSRPRKGQPRALPWWKLEKMAARGEVEPILHNGRVIGYRTPPERGRSETT